MISLKAYGYCYLPKSEIKALDSKVSALIRLNGELEENVS